MTGGWWHSVFRVKVNPFSGSCIHSTAQGSGPDALGSEADAGLFLCSLLQTGGNVNQEAVFKQGHGALLKREEEKRPGRISWSRIYLQCGRPGFDPWVGKISWRRERLPTPAFWPGEFHGLCSPWGRKESDTTRQLALSLFFSHCRIKKGWGWG